ncbi:DUF3592 domain-containing protein [Aliagarivorans marinus]|uniref:DUF3592 domain-containing protein n=1 Tax=Aliagarivorans marinus TaxID=561965 RepID=UPI0003F5263F|nr:DUF3592 domain-containing protein [Aliagarivorans marinus]
MKAVSIIKYLFSAIGLAMLAGAYFMYSNTQSFVSSAVTTEGVVTQLIRSRSSDSTSYYPVVRFKIKSGREIEFSSSTGSNPPSYSEGERVEVLYLESAPQEAEINAFFPLWGGVAVLGGLGAIFSIIGLSIFASKHLKNTNIKHLKQNGTRVKAKLQGVNINRSLSVNGRNPYQIHAQWRNPRTSEMHVFSSENLWFDPTDYIKQQEITVLIEMSNPKKYYVDVSCLPKMAR